MTKEEFIKPILEMVNFGGDIELAKKLFNEFFEANVCIPKGENRHSYADVLHEWIEGKNIVASEDRKHFHDVSSAKSKLNGKYYINKCNKKIYEWQFRAEDESVIVVTKFMTEDELLIDDKLCGIPTYLYTKKTETKRERK